MSGSTIGGVVGGVVGWFVGGPVGAQWGWMIGSAVGAIVDPERIEGPRLSEAKTQTAQDGVPLIYGYGTFPCAGNVAWVDEVKEHRHKEGGKGGPEQVTYTYTISYMVVVCKGPISGYKLIRRNGKVVYDARTDAELLALGYTSEEIAETRAAQAEFLQRATLYYGTNDQMPDPTMVAVKGAGEVPAYTGIAYIVMTDDETREGEYAQFEFVVAKCGERHEGTVNYLPVKWDPDTATGGAGDVLENGLVWMASTNEFGYVTAEKFLSNGDWYWESTTAWTRVSGSSINHMSGTGVVRQSDGAYALAIQRMVDNQPQGGAKSGGDILFTPVELVPDWVPAASNILKQARIRNRLTFTESGATYQIAIDDGAWTTLFSDQPGSFAPYAFSRGTSLDGQISARRAWLFTIPDDFIYPIPNGALGLGATSGGVGVPIPDAPGYYIDPQTGVINGPSGTQIDPCQPALGEIVADQCERRGVASRDVSELTDLVGGYRVAAPSSSQRNIQGLQPGFFFSASEFDGVLHFPKRGRDLTFALTHDDFVEREGEPIKWERTQEKELLRKVTVGYVDPETTYTATTQQAERRAATIDAQGEGTIELPITGSKDWAAQVADKSIKVAWGETEECTFHVTLDHAELVTGAEGTVPYLDGSTTVVRIERIDDEGLVRMVTAKRTRKHLYESNASGVAKPLPRFPGSNIRGPTDGVLLNIPVLIDQDDRPGIHWAAAGMTSGWQGGRLQIYRAGQWETVGDVTNPAGVGTLLAPLPAHSGDVDTANVLSVRFNEELESVTWVNLLQERNPLAILRPDGTAEIVQFENATAVAPGQYDLTQLLRGRLATVPDDHATGARVVLLDTRVQYATLEPTDLGQTLQYRFVSLGTDPDAAPVQTITLTTMESQREWPVYMLQVEQDGDDYILTWLARDRLGTDVFPIRSTHWAGYEVSYSHPGGSGSVVVNTETHTFNLPGASDITFSVAQLNQYTGAGPAETVHIP